MVRQVLDVLDPRPGDAVLDVTFGTAGHALALCKRIGEEGLLVGADADPQALQAASRRLQAAATCPCRLLRARFSELPRLLTDEGLTRFDIVLADLGIGTHQLDRPERGFSFGVTAPLDMRYDPAATPDARQVVNSASQQELARIFRQFGEERYAEQIASRIVEQREQAPIETTTELAELVKQVYARRSRRGQSWRIHPATRVMMALRICVNREMEELDLLLRMIPHVLSSGGRAAVLTYHSLEARRVKRAWAEQVAEGLIELIRPAPIKPTDQEVARNPRARSAQLRACRRK